MVDRKQVKGKHLHIYLEVMLIWRYLQYGKNSQNRIPLNVVKNLFG